MQTIYGQGGRKFWVHNTGPLGCLPQKLSLGPKTSSNLDQYGCLSGYNDAAKVFNEGLRHLCQQLRTELKDATIVYVDMYNIKYDLIANSSKYGKPIWQLMDFSCLFTFAQYWLCRNFWYAFLKNSEFFLDFNFFKDTNFRWKLGYWILVKELNFPA